MSIPPMGSFINGVYQIMGFLYMLDSSRHTIDTLPLKTSIQNSFISIFNAAYTQGRLTVSYVIITIVIIIKIAQQKQKRCEMRERSGKENI